MKSIVHRLKIPIMRFPLLLALCLLASFPCLVAGGQLAFPGAEGHGRFTTGGRGGAVIAVANLNDNGPGSLRAAIEAEGPRTIIFRVSGTIFLESALEITEGNLTIAGQTAPGDGITLANFPLQLSADNVIIRFIRVRLGDLKEQQADAFGCRYASDVMIDHCTFSWAVDETATAYQNKNFTMQWCIISEALHNSVHEKGNHGFGGIWGGESATFHHNLIAHHRSRLPRFNGARYGDYAEWGDDQVDHRNNVIYNWGNNNAYGGEPNGDGSKAHYNIVGNYYKPGPATPRDAADRILEPYPNKSGQLSEFYVADNHVVGAPEVTRDNSKGVHGLSAEQLKAARVRQPFPSHVATESALEAYEQVLAHGGASFPHRDSVDVRVVNEVRTGTAPHGKNGHIDSQKAVGGFPELESLPAPADTDKDGMPDDWENRHDLDPRNPEDRNADSDGDGYSNLEEYLNGLVEDHFPQRSK